MKKVTFIVLCLALIAGLPSCEGTATKEGKIVKDAEGNYYRLTGVKTVGDERYSLIEVDTAEFNF